MRRINKLLAVIVSVGFLFVSCSIESDGVSLEFNEFVNISNSSMVDKVARKWGCQIDDSDPDIKYFYNADSSIFISSTEYMVVFGLTGIEINNFDELNDELVKKFQYSNMLDSISAHDLGVDTILVLNEFKVGKNEIALSRSIAKNKKCFGVIAQIR